ncbi:TetR/AcrR family transcriptional regulator [Vibrio variabilis]|uniref:TetR/AcrR family transcriptional regulator n=1 Tax=Vibrio variabilis TaxID=990271 RepID=UPI000DD76737|nr:TetR/AcrR family transcriptional regulator [Vibrio variabilis]
MPKIVDHDKRRQEIALKATTVFLEHGYKNVGMRQLCDLLGMSKSAVYHYYKSKDELFKAATEAMVSFDSDALIDFPRTTDASRSQRIDNFIAIFRQLSPRFFQEMQLVADYIEVIGHENVSSDPSMNVANQRYLALLNDYVCNTHSNELYTLMLGLLNHQLMTGAELEDAYVSSLVGKHIA